MTYKFRNSYHLSDRMIAEYTEITIQHRPKIGGLIAAVIVLLALLNSIRNGLPVSALVFLILLFIIVTALAVTPRRAKKKAEGMLGKNLPVQVLFGNHVEQTIDGETIRVEYKDISAVYYLPDVWVLISGKGKAVLVEPESFTSGKPEKFREFIEGRCGDTAFRTVS